jgi:DnaJ homolog subfamily C member 28
MPDIENHIQKAIQEGAFDNLPNKGKPLKLDDDTHVDPEWRLANHMLKSSGFTLPWIEKRQELLSALELGRASLKRTWDWRSRALADGQPYAQVEDEWQRSVKAFQEEIIRLNAKIKTYNLEAPSDRFQLPMLTPEREIAAITTVSG